MWLTPIANAMLRRFGSAVLLSLWAAACAAQSPIKHRPASSGAGGDNGLSELEASPDSVHPLRVHVEAPARAGLGAAVPIRLRVTNTGNTQVVVLQVAPAPDYDVTVTRDDGRLVWQRLPTDAVLTTAGLQYPLAPGESHNLEVIEWDQRDLHGRRVGPGRYWVQGIFYGGVAYSGQREIQTDTVSLLVEH